MAKLNSNLESLLRDALARHALTKYYEQISAHARLTFLLRVTAVEADHDIPIGTSRFGGTPDLPPDFDWPRNPEDDLLLDFVGQINLAQLPSAGQELPTSGLLLLFSQQEGADDNPHVIHLLSSPMDTLSRAETPSPEMFSDEDTDEPSGNVLISEFIPSISLPDSMTAFPDFDDDFHDPYSELVSELHDAPGQKEPTSRLLGYPFNPYGSPLLGDDWELLAEVQSHFADGNCYMNFWDAGCLQLMVPQSQLKDCTFEQSVASICSM